jgi:adenylate cyclase
MRFFRFTPFKLGVLITLGFALLSFLREINRVEPPLLRRLDWLIYDSYYRLQGKVDPGDRVVIVAADEKSMAEFGQWPWPRRVHADIINRLTDAGAKAIALDILFSKPDATDEECRKKDPKGVCDSDEQLGKAVARAPIVPGYMFFPNIEELKGISPEYYLGGEKYLARSAFEGKVTSLYPGFFEAVGVLTSVPEISSLKLPMGHFNHAPEDDGTVRRGVLVFRFRGRHYPALALATAGKALGVRPALEAGTARVIEEQSTCVELTLHGRRIPVDESGCMWLRYHGPGGTFRYFSAVDIAKGVVPPSAFKDRVVVYGVDAGGISEYMSTPTDPLMPAIEIHATSLKNILDQHHMERPNVLKVLEILGVLLAGVVWSLLLARVSLAISAPVTLASMGAWQYAAYSLFFKGGLWTMTAGMWIEVALLITAIVLHRYYLAKRVD